MWCKPRSQTHFYLAYSRTWVMSLILKKIKNDIKIKLN